jgi:HEPN superfamily AbiU2-like protein
MTVHTAAEAKIRNIEAMGADLGELYDALWQQLAALHRKWEEYVILFGSKPERVELLNKAAPAFFRIVQDSLFEDVLLHAARLTDWPKTGGKPNLTIRRLPEAVADLNVREAAAVAVAKAVSATDFCRDWRNRHIAHKDLDLAYGAGAEPLLPASREKVALALKALSDALNVVAQHYLDTTTFFELGGSLRGAESLLRILEDGVKARETRLRG